MTLGPAEAPLLRRAALTIGAQTAAAVAVVLLAVGALAFILTVRDQHAATERTVRTAALSADDLDDPPLGVVLVETSATGTIGTSPGAPPEFAGTVVTGLPLGGVERSIDGRRYELFTVAARAGPT